MATMTLSRLQPLRAQILPILLAGAFFLTACAARDVPMPVATPTPDRHPTLADFWDGRAEFVVDVVDTGLPMGESDTVVMDDGRLRSYVHASAQSAGVVDQCGDPVPFPGCVVLLESTDQGRSFVPWAAATTATAGQTDNAAAAAQQCLMPCARCPCDSTRDHIDQQQYPRVVRNEAAGADAATWWMVYEYRGGNFMRTGTDGVHWSTPAEVPLTGIWQTWLRPCRPEEAIGVHPHAPAAYDCLVGGPPGLWVDAEHGPGREIYVFVALGQNPSSMGCYRGPAGGPASALRKCTHNPLFTGIADYGPPDATGPATNPYFDFRTISSADLIAEEGRYYMFFEGVRGPGPGDAGDTQFALGLARAATKAIDGPWEVYPGNPILVDMPGNVGVGHADVVVIDGETVLFTSLDGAQRSRLVLRWRPEP
ncbi:MAG: hypothetical protein KDD83_06145 [Caldilineaceae bacterium]|nr:hypothetical protein [Caldilineaceae bacterium]